VKVVKALSRTNVTLEVLPFLFWFFSARGWQLWTKGLPMARKTVAYQKKEGTGEPVIVAGDSLAMGVGLDHPETESVAALLGDYFSESPLINYGQNGRCVADVLETLKDEAVPARCRCIVLIVGTMDMIHNTPSEELERDLRDLFVLLGKKTDHVVLVLAGSMEAGPRFAGHETLLDALGGRSYRVHNIFRRVTADYPQVHYVGSLFNWSLRPRILAEPEKWFSPDGFHPSKAWHHKVFSILTGLLQKA
jgi:hypothetical protein